MKSLREAFVLVLVALAPALLAVALHPDLQHRDRAGLRPEEVRLTEVRDWKSDVLWIDARSEEEFASDQIPGAINIQLPDFERGLGTILQMWQSGVPIVVYCSSTSCEASREMARRLTESGLKGVHYLHGGWESWVEANN